MRKQPKLRVREPAPPAPASKTPKAHILASLAYLTSNCASEECQAILKLSLDLCLKCSTFEEEGQRIFYNELMTQEGLAAALGYLRCEANRNHMGDFEEILEAAGTLITYYLCHHGRRRHLSVVEH